VKVFEPIVTVGGREDEPEFEIGMLVVPPWPSVMITAVPDGPAERDSVVPETTMGAPPGRSVLPSMT
jgi:hypothetical protein